MSHYNPHLCKENNQQARIKSLCDNYEKAKFDKIHYFIYRILLCRPSLSISDAWSGNVAVKSCWAQSKILSILVFQNLKNKPALSFKKNDFYIHGEKVKLYSGSIHYFRIPRQYWRDRLLMMKEAGLNAIIRVLKCSDSLALSSLLPIEAPLRSLKILN